MANTLNQDYAVKKGDSIQKIAMKFGHRDGKAIWKAPENRDLVNKRRDPDKIQPGDKLVIPPNDKQLKEHEDELNSLNATRDANLKLRDALRAEVARREESVQVYEDLIKSTVDCKNDILEGLEKDFRSMQNTGLAVDTVKKLITAIPGGVFKLAKVGATAAAAGRDRLKKLAEEVILDKVVETATEKIKDKPVEMIKDALKERKNDDNTAVAALGTLLDSWEKIQSPSFWANVIVHRDEDWDKAVTHELGDDLKERMVQVEKIYNPHIHKLYEARNAAKSKVEISRKYMSECEGRAKTAGDKASQMAKP